MEPRAVTRWAATRCAEIEAPVRSAVLARLRYSSQVGANASTPPFTNESVGGARREAHVVRRGRRQRVGNEVLELVREGQSEEHRGWRTHGDGAAEEYYRRACGLGVGVRRHERRKVLGGRCMKHWSTGLGARRSTTASPQHAHLGPMALPKSNHHPDPKPLPFLKPWKKTAEQKNMMR